MKLKTRLRIACIMIVVGPMVLFVLFLVMFVKMHMLSLEKEYGIEFPADYLVNTVQTMNETTAEVWEKIYRQSQTDPDEFMNFSYLQDLDDELKEKLSFLLIIKDGEVYYENQEEDLSLLIDQLPPYGSAEDDDKENGVYIGGPQKAMVKQVDLLFTDGTNGSAYIITTSEGVLPRIQFVLITGSVIMLFVLIINGLFLTFWIYKGIHTPIRRLQEATKQIADGNLDFTLETDGKDEISDLTRDFEKMRQQLASSEEEKKRYDRESRELISNISHDLKTPVTTVKGYVEGIMDGVADTPEKLDRYIRTIYSKANEMDRLINELTFYSKIDTNRIPYHFIRLNAAEYFDDCAEEMRPELEERKIHFLYEFLADRNTVIVADPEQMMRVINNIIGNSIKYIDKVNGEISLRVLDVGDFIQVDIGDNGKGIEAKDLTAVFDRFYRTDESRNSSQGGSGIGLSIVRKIIEDHSGKIWATSQPGNGTTMHFVIRKYQEAAGV